MLPTSRQCSQTLMMCDEIGNHSGRIDNFETDKASQSLQLWMDVIHFSFVPVGKTQEMPSNDHSSSEFVVTSVDHFRFERWTQTYPRSQSMNPIDTSPPYSPTNSSNRKPCALGFVNLIMPPPPICPLNGFCGAPVSPANPPVIANVPPIPPASIHQNAFSAYSSTKA